MRQKTPIRGNHRPFYQRKRQYIEVPLSMPCGAVLKLWHRLTGMFLAPLYLLAARIRGAPGINVHIKCARLAVRLLLFRRLPVRECYALGYFPMDSTRYFELHEVFSCLVGVPFNRYLDISSPRIVPLMILMENKNAVADVINPDSSDLQLTRRLADALQLGDRCTFRNCTLEKADLQLGSYDLITSISVLEHVSDDREAVHKMWSLLRPCGRLILTLPCMAQPLEQYISHNPYGVLSPGSDGYTFWQRYYDADRLGSVIFGITGMPTRIAIYGERHYGLFFRNASMKRLMGPLYPFWREPYMMAQEYRYFQSVDELPGEGVILLEFIKP